MRHFLVVTFVALCACAALSAQTNLPDDVVKQLDSAMTRTSVEDFSRVLDRSRSAAWYPRLEAYALRGIRQLVIENKLEVARDMSFALVDKNLDNIDAMDLYQSIQRSIARRDEEAEKAERQRQIAAIKQQTEEKKIREDVNKTYRTVTNTASGKTVYLDQDVNQQYRSFNWEAALGLAQFAIQSDPDFFSVKYGVSLEGGFVSNGENSRAGIDLFGNALFFGLAGDQSLDWMAGGTVFYMPGSSRSYFSLRAGYAMYGWNYGSFERPVELFSTPFAGIGLRDVKMGQTGLMRLSLDYLAGHLFADDIVAAVCASLRLSAMLADMQDFDVHVYAGIRDTILLKNNGLKNDARVYFAIGVADYE